MTGIPQTAWLAGSQHGDSQHGMVSLRSAVSKDGSFRAASAEKAAHAATTGVCGEKKHLRRRRRMGKLAFKNTESGAG